MKNCTLGQIAEYAGARLSRPDLADQKARGVSIDTRTLEEGEVFLPLIGERLDAHQFVNQAFEKGALASFFDQDHTLPDTDHPFLLVEDTEKAFRRLALHYRNSLKAQVIGVTGSNGKTTTKDILFSVLRRHFCTNKTIGNFNNQIGVPRTLLDLEEETAYGIVEMGMSHFGEIAMLSKLAQPHIAIITNVGEAHLEELGSRENIARAKMEITEGLGPDDLFIYNSDNEILQKEVESRSLPCRIIRFGQNDQADFKLKLFSSNAGGSRFFVNGKPWQINLLGSYQMYNAVVGIIVGQLLGLSDEEIQKGLHVEDRTKMRTELVNCHGFDLLVDCYNSSPQSLREALKTTALLNGYRKKIAILGDMKELGEREKAIHYEIGQEIDPSVFSDLIFYGPLSKYMLQGAEKNFSSSRLFWFSSKSDLVNEMKNLIEPNTLVLVKASRTMRLEEVVESISTITTNRCVKK